MEKLQEEDVAALIEKKEAQLQLKAEVDEINRQAQAQKIIRAEQEKIQDLKVKSQFKTVFYRSLGCGIQPTQGRARGCLRSRS